jgi:hypothetical protein
MPFKDPKVRRRYFRELMRRRRASKPQAKPRPAQPNAGIVRTAGRRQEFGEIGKLQAEITKLKSDNFKLKAMLAEAPDAAKLRKKVVDQQVEMNSMRQAMKRVAKERDEYRSRDNPKYREARPLLTRQNHNIIINALHYDRMRQLTAAELAAAEKVAIALRPLFIED